MLRNRATTRRGAAIFIIPAGLLLMATMLGAAIHAIIGQRPVLHRDVQMLPAATPNSVATTLVGPLTLKYPIWWAAPFHSGSGYSSEAISYVLGLAQEGLVRGQDLWLSASGGTPRNGVNSPEVTKVLKALDYGRQRKVLNARDLQRPAIVICHSFPTFWRLPGRAPMPEADGPSCPTPEMQGRHAYRVGRTMFETDRLPGFLADHVRNMDEVWVPTEFNRRTFARSGVNESKIFVLPESINLTEFDPERHKPTRLSAMRGNSLAIGAPRAEGKEGLPFVFLSIFKWETRKGWEVLLKAFLEEFKGEEDVELHILTHPFMETVPDWGHKVRKGASERCGFGEVTDWSRYPRVYVSAAYVPPERFPELYRSADALVVPTRGEGWGRPQMEAMAMQLPVISTNWSGLTAFLNDQTGYPIHVQELVEAKADGPTFFAPFSGSRWAQPNATHLRQLMRHVAGAGREEGRAKGRAARRYLQANFSPEAVAQVLARLVLGVQRRAEERVRAGGGAGSAQG